LREAVDRVGRLYAADKKAGSPVDAALKHMGFSGPHGKAMVVLSALRKYGLVEDVSGRIVPTQRAIEILVLPETDRRRTQALQDSALSPEIFRELYEQYRETGIPSDETLRSELVAYKGFNPNAVTDFVADFKDSLDFAGLTGNGELSSALEEEPEMESVASQSSQGKLRLPDGATGIPAMRAARGRSYAWALSGDFTAKLDLIGEPQSEEDLEALRDYMDITIKALGRSLKKAQSEGEKQ
jgi:hypothetical protein